MNYNARGPLRLAGLSLCVPPREAWLEPGLRGAEEKDGYKAPCAPWLRWVLGGCAQEGSARGRGARQRVQKATLSPRLSRAAVDAGAAAAWGTARLLAPIRRRCCSGVRLLSPPAGAPLHDDEPGGLGALLPQPGKFFLPARPPALLLDAFSSLSQSPPPAAASSSRSSSSRSSRRGCSARGSAMHTVQKDTTFTKIFVGGLPYHTTDSSLRKYFEVFGDLEEAVVITDRQTGKSRGYGFVSATGRCWGRGRCEGRASGREGGGRSGQCPGGGGRALEPGGAALSSPAGERRSVLSLGRLGRGPVAVS